MEKFKSPKGNTRFTKEIKNIKIKSKDNESFHYSKSQNVGKNHSYKEIISVKNKKVLKGYKKYYMYSNHTLQYGDVFNPFIVNFPRRSYILCSPSNLGIPIIGKILPIAGALPIPEESIDATFVQGNEGTATTVDPTE